MATAQDSDRPTGCVCSGLAAWVHYSFCPVKPADYPTGWGNPELDALIGDHGERLFVRPAPPTGRPPR